jgi:hypothetical protein
MAFVYEKVPETDKDFWGAMELKNFAESYALSWNSSRSWCADRQRNAFLVCIGKAGVETPIAYDLWWNDNRIRIYINSSVGWYSPVDLLDGTLVVPIDDLDFPTLTALVEEALSADKSSFSNSVHCCGGMNWKLEKRAIK